MACHQGYMRYLHGSLLDELAAKINSSQFMYSSALPHKRHTHSWRAQSESSNTAAVAIAHQRLAKSLETYSLRLNQ